MYLDWCVVSVQLQVGWGNRPPVEPPCVAAHHIQPWVHWGLCHPQELFLQCPAGVHRHQSACGDDQITVVVCSAAAVAACAGQQRLLTPCNSVGVAVIVYRVWVGARVLPRCKDVLVPGWLQN